MFVRLDRPRGSRRSSKKKSPSREQQAVVKLARVFKFNGLSSVTYIWVPTQFSTS